MAKVILRQETIDDLTDIWNYTFQAWSENQADKYYATIKFTCKEIGENPDIIVYHQISEDEVEIIRILHERMDLKNRINE